jgi:hypothetical protein
MNNKLCLFLILFIFSLGSMTAQEIKVPVGRVVDSIPAADSTSSSFALYLPQNFTTEKQWPVLFVFDAEGRGKASTQLFKGVAEEQSYVIAAANLNINQDSLQNDIKKVGAIINQVAGMLPLNKQEVYAVGLGAGGKLASALPLVYNNISGVLAVENGWLNTNYLKGSNKFMYSAIACTSRNSKFTLEGIVDFLDEKDHPTELNFYSCGQKVEWPIADVIYNSIAGFTLKAIRDGKRERDPVLIQKLYEHEVENAERLRRSRNYYLAFEKFKKIEDKYEDLGLDVDLRDKIKSIRRNKAFRQQRRDYRNFASKEKEKREEYLNYMENDVITSNFENTGWWAQEVAELKETQKNTSGAEAKMAARLVGYLDGLSKTYYDDYVNAPVNARTKVFVSILRTIFDKKDPEAYLNIIKIAGHDGDHETALLYLEDLLKTGFDELEALYDIEGILDLKLSKEYNKKIKEYLGEAKYYEAEI